VTTDEYATNWSISSASEEGEIAAAVLEDEIEASMLEGEIESSTVVLEIEIDPQPRRVRSKRERERERERERDHRPLSSAFILPYPCSYSGVPFLWKMRKKNSQLVYGSGSRRKTRHRPPNRWWPKTRHRAPNPDGYNPKTGEKSVIGPRTGGGQIPPLSDRTPSFSNRPHPLSPVPSSIGFQF
jgi:hypothetical protein